MRARTTPGDELLEKISSLIKIGIGLVFVLTPLAIFPGISFPLSLSKTIALQVLTEVVFALWFVLVLFRKEYEPKITPLSATIFAFLIVISSSGLLGVDVGKSLWGVMEQNTGIVFLWHLFALYLVIRSFAGSLELAWFAKVNVITGTVVGVIALIQRFGGWPASLMATAPPSVAFAPFSNSPFLAAYLLFIFFLAWWLAVEAPEKEWRWVAAIAVILSGAVILLTETRGAIVGLAVGSLILFARYFMKNAFRGSVVLITAATLLLIFTNFFAELPGVRRFYSPSLNENLEQREAFWQIAWEGFMERPVLGWGWGNFDIVFAKYYDPVQYESRINYVYVDAPSKPFNIFFEYLTSAGVLGLLGYLSVLAVAFYKLLGKSYGRLMVPLLVAYLVQNMVLFDTVATYPIFFALLAFVDRGETSIEQKGNGAERKIISAVLIMVLVAIFFLMYFMNWRTVYAARYHALAYREMDLNKDFGASLDNWRIATRTPNPYSDRIAYDYAVEVRRAFDEKIEHDDWPSLHRKVIRTLKKITESHPENPNGYIELGSAYNSFAGFDPSYREKAEKALRKALEMNPANVKVYVPLAKSKLLQGEREGAYDTLRQAQKLHYGLSHPQIMLALLYYQIGEKPQALLEIKEALAEELVPRYAEEYVVFGDLFADFKEYESALEMYKGVFENPSLPGTKEKNLVVNTALKTGLIYNLLGKTEESKHAMENLGFFLKREDPNAYQQFLMVLKMLEF